MKMFYIAKRIWVRIVYRMSIIILHINTDIYMRTYCKYLSLIGVKLLGKPKYIDPSTYIDRKDPSYNEIGDNVTISREVMILNHDYSITAALCSVGKVIRRNQGEKYMMGKVIIGNNTFIGARATLLPGTRIGNNCIIGACTVVKGEIPDNSVVIGNPSRIIGSSKGYAEKYANEALVE